MPRIEQRPDGTFIKIMTPVEADLYNKVSKEGTDRINADLELTEQLGVLGNAHTGLVSKVNSLETGLTGETDARQVADQTLHDLISSLSGVDGTSIYNKEDIRLLLSPWKVEEIDFPYTTPSDELFDKADSFAIREGYYFGENAEIHVDRGIEFKDNVVRRYTILVLMEQADIVKLKFKYDGNLSTSINGDMDEIGESSYDVTIERSYDLREGWNIIQILIAHKIGIAGLSVEHDLVAKSKELDCLVRKSGIISEDMIGPGVIQPGHLNQSGNYKVRQLTVTENLIVGNESTGSIKIGNGIMMKTEDGFELDSPLIVKSIQTQSGLIGITDIMEVTISTNGQTNLGSPLGLIKLLGVSVGDTTYWGSKNASVNEDGDVIWTGVTILSPLMDVVIIYNKLI